MPVRKVKGALVEANGRRIALIYDWDTNSGNADKRFTSEEYKARVDFLLAALNGSDEMCTCKHVFHWHFEHDKVPSGRTGCGHPGCDCTKFQPETKAK